MDGPRDGECGREKYLASWSVVGWSKDGKGLGWTEPPRVVAGGLLQLGESLVAYFER